ncbi:MAG: gliding motility-associated-like protein, partial [Paraglaciecola sp.]
QWFPSNPDLISCDDCPDPTFTPQSAADSFYTLTVIDENGCEGEVTYFVNVLPQCSADLVAIPNAFTPNGDGINDVFGPVIDGNFQKIFDADDSGFSMRIYNRWGKKVFEAAGGNPTWDGTLENEAGGADVYIYIIEVNCGEERKMLTGDVALIR